MVKFKKSVKRKAKTPERERGSYLIWSILVPVFIMLLFALWHYRTGINYYVKNILSESTPESKERGKHDARNIFLMSSYSDYIFGIDISEYQGKILWDSVSHINEEFPVDFIFIRATMGAKAKDKEFTDNWKAVDKMNKMKGAYHYFRPNENSIKQADNFIKTVKLKSGDLPPVLDIEEKPRSQSMDSLRVGLKRWLDRVEDHYKVKPIVYSGDSYFTDFLEKEFKDYTLWIANYNFWIEKPKVHWDFWQFSEKGNVRGIRGFVDLNMYHGEMEKLEQLCIPYN